MLEEVNPKLAASGKDRNQAVRVSGSKEQAVAQLRNAIDHRAIAIEQVYKMLCGGEENGSQHIFYYRPTGDQVAAKIADGNTMASALLGSNWKEEQKFPQFYLQPEGVCWSDFRISADGWTAKLYAGMERWTFVSEQKEGDSRSIRTYERSLSREIYLVKWHAFGLLELRVPRDSSNKAILNSLSNLWTVFAIALNSQDFEPFDLTEASRKLIDQHSPENVDYRLGDAHFMDEDAGSARFAPPSEQDDLMSEHSREKAIRFFNNCRELAVVWLPTNSTDAIEDELRTVIGKIRPNEVLVASRTTAEAVDYVTNRLWQLAKPAP